MIHNKGKSLLLADVRLHVFDHCLLHVDGSSTFLSVPEAGQLFSPSLLHEFNERQVDVSLQCGDHVFFDLSR